MATTPRLGITLPDESTNATTQFFIDRYNEIDANAARKNDVDTISVQLTEKPTMTTSYLNYYVDIISGNDINDGLTSGTAFRTIQHAIDVLPDVINHAITIYLADGVYNELILFRNKIGGGSVTLISTSNNNANCIINGQFVGYSVGIYLNVNYITIKRGSGYALSSGEPGTVYLWKCPAFNLDYSKLDGNNKSDYGLRALISSGAIRSYSVINCTSAIYSDLTAHVHSGFCSSSSNNDIGLYASRGAVISREGTQPSATTATQTLSGGVVR